MRILKLALLSVIILFVLATAISLLLPSTITISRAINIYSDKNKIYKAIYELHEWKHWVHNKDSLPVSVIIQEKKIFLLGSTKAWIAASDKNQIITNWQVGTGKPYRAAFNIIEQHGSDYITLQWEFIQDVKWYPWEKLASIVSDKILGQFMEACLDNVKNYVEQQGTKD